MSHGDIIQETTHPIISTLSTISPERAKKGKVVSAEEAVRVIRDGDTLATGGFVGIGFPEEIAIALEAYYLTTHNPKDLTLVYRCRAGGWRRKRVEAFWT
jgi:propionate CoA-transferase